MTVSGDNLKSTPITNLDAQPMVVATTGEGAAGFMKVLTDSIATTAAAAATSAYRLCRFPTAAKLKRVKIYTNGMESTSSDTYDVNVAFSDSTQDGTPQAYQAAIPTSALTGAVTTPAAYSSANKMFGTALSLGGTSGAAKETDVTFSGTFTPVMRDKPMFENMGFTGVLGTPQDPGGFFDIYVVLAAVGTSTAGTLAAQVDYVL